MKKIIAAIVMTVCMVSATFALDFEVGARGNFGRNLSTDMDSTWTEIADTTMETPFEFGFGAYANFALLGGLGVQAELNLTKSKIQFNNPTISNPDYTTYDYDTWLLDVPVMAWLNLDLWKFTVGFGAGVNFAFDLNAGSLSEVYEETKSLVKDNVFKMGFVCGADFKFYITNHIGLVLDARWIIDFQKKTATYDTGTPIGGIDYPTIEFQRNSFYAGIGLEFKFF